MSVWVPSGSQYVLCGGFLESHCLVRNRTLLLMACAYYILARFESSSMLETNKMFKHELSKVKAPTLKILVLNSNLAVLLLTNTTTLCNYYVVGLN